MKQMKLSRNFLNLFLQKYQEGLEESIIGSDFVYDIIDAFYYNLKKVTLSRGGSYIDSPKLLKTKRQQ